VSSERRDLPYEASVGVFGEAGFGPTRLRWVSSERRDLALRGFGERLRRDKIFPKKLR
jgi:hypothetical protein